MATGVLAAPALGQVVEDDHLLKPGQFTWHPERSPEGPVAVIVSIPDQLTHVYRNGVRIGVSTCSTGRPGHATPTGVFTILQKQVDHHSNIYDGAEMADMERLTWTGIALHVGGLPGYPSSHGCVHLPRAFSDRLYTITRVGTVVIIADATSAPAEIVHPGLLLSPAAESEIDGELQAKARQKLPMAGAAAPAGPLAILVSSADKRFVIQLGGDTVASGAVTIADPATPLGEHVLMLAGAGADGARWQAFRYGHEAGGPPEPRPAQIMARLQVDEAGRAAIARYLHQGALLITTDLPLTPDRQSGSDLVVISS